MENINIPIYRAKKIDSDEYVIGFYSSAYDIHHYVITHLGVDTKTSTVYQMSTDIHKIDPTTLAIHFPDMLDSQGNKIFASLGDDGKGGDIVESYYYTDANNKEHKLKHIAKWSNKYKCILFVNDNNRYIDNIGNGTGNVQMWTMKESKIIGIQK